MKHLNESEALKFKIRGMWFEFIGLFIVLVTVAWQILFTNWYEDQARIWAEIIQEEVNLATLQSLKDISYQIAVDDSVKSRQLASTVRQRINETQLRALRERDRRSQFIEDGQYSFVMLFHAILFFLGALMMVLGKWWTLKAFKGKKLALNSSG